MVIGIRIMTRWIQPIIITTGIVTAPVTINATVAIIFSAVIIIGSTIITTVISGNRELQGKCDLFVRCIFFVVGQPFLNRL